MTRKIDEYHGHQAIAHLVAQGASRKEVRLLRQMLKVGMDVKVEIFEGERPPRCMVDKDILVLGS